ncbi:hypothetical protein B0J12DRAFT_726658 [Macrophomina phaseolina]|uniref:Uncharacterized protein n=1 Tax=Macrophomina phaseolina TaxID=35725 RepID=A0ABQ8GH96_9PEZI|nr:hypothetical protein B0J12DRAFT_726658 [Macrophomina phaseolina]
MSSAIPSAELEATLKDLKISTSTGTSPSHSPAPGAKPSKKTSNKKDVVDSWEDAASDSDGSGTETEPDSTTSPINTLQKHASEGPLAPPPTPASPQFDGPYGSIDARFANATAGAGAGAAGAGAGSGPARRPEKTTSVAARMIAAGIGSRAPKRTEEEREYDRVMREKERKRRDKEREEAAAAKQKEEEAKKAVWDD